LIPVASKRNGAIVDIEERRRPMPANFIDLDMVLA
jgi:hypothetical protein